MGIYPKKDPEPQSVHEVLKREGFAVQYFSAYENSDETQHGHDFLEMAYIISGKALHMLGEDSCRQDRGSITILNYNQTHSIVTPEGPVEIMNIYLDLDRFPLPQLSEKLGPVVQSIIPLHPLFGYEQNKIIHLHLQEPETVTNLLMAINSEQHKRRADCRKVINSYFKILLTHMCRAAVEVGIKNDFASLNGQMRKMELIRQRLDESYTQDMSLDMLSGEFNIHKSLLCRKFKNYTGKTVGNYVLHKRIERALLMLRTSDIKILAIAMECGFNDLSNFNRAFKKLLGVSPAQYRKRQK